MRFPTVIGLSLMSWVVGAATAHAQYTLPPAGIANGGSSYGTGPQGRELTGGPPSEVLPETRALSQWITYDYGDYGPVGDGIPVLSEVFIRSGFAIPTSAGPLGNLGKTLGLGWQIEGGGKLLFFNQPLTEAWTLWTSISNVANRGARSNIHYTISDFFPDGINPITGAQIFTRQHKQVTVTSYNRTYVNLGFGKEWYLFGSALTPDNCLRVGVDTGGRWGSAVIRLAEIQHRTDVVGAVFASFYLDYAIPVGAATILTGVRSEWDYTWSDILQGANDVMSINALFTLGLLF